MKDIDFDELDRAVSSVLGQQGDKSPDGSVEKAQAPTPESTMAPKVSSTEQQQAPAVEAVTPVTPSPAAKPATPSLAVKRRGKFMDVMHPSADMQKAPTPAAKKITPRPTHLVQPINSPVAPDVPADKPAEPTASLDESSSLIGAAPAPAPDSTDLTAPTPEQSEQSSYDTKDHTGVTEDVEEKSTEAPQAFGTASESSDMADEAPTLTDSSPDEEKSTLAERLSEESEASYETPETVATDQSSDEAPSPATSPGTTPFLSDTQVEKRPLGAFGPVEASSTEQPDAEAASSAPSNPDFIGPDLTSTTAAATVATPLPRELQPDVVGVESVQETETLEVPASSAGPFAANVGAAPENTGDRVEGHPLFDTSAYHEPVSAVSHGMPGWAKWTLGLLACLAVGAGVGYFLFTAGL